MSEHLTHSHKPESQADRPQESLKSHKSLELQPSRPEHKLSAEKSQSESEPSPQKAIEELSRSAESLSLSSKEVSLPKTESRPDEHEPSSSYVNKELRAMALQRTMIRVRKQLNPADKLMSKVIHIPVVEKISETASKTVARPSGLLGGGLLAVVGTTVYYYLSRRFGYEYNFSAFLVLVSFGFLAGLAIELVGKLLKNKSN